MVGAAAAKSAMRAAAAAHSQCMSAAAWSFVIDQGADFYRKIRLTESTGSAVDLDGYSVRAQVRASVDSPTVLAEWTTENGFFSITDAGGGEITLSIPAAVTTTYAWPDGGVYDIELVNPSGGVERLLMGAITVSPEVTR